jgi:hypothetical protein
MWNSEVAPRVEAENPKNIQVLHKKELFFFQKRALLSAV